MVSLEKVCESLLHIRKERRKLMEQKKRLKEIRLEVDLVSNSSFLNGDVVIKWSDLELRQTNRRVISLVCVPYRSQVHIHASSLYLVVCLVRVDIVYIFSILSILVALHTLP
jgi:hypothetical protein